MTTRMERMMQEFDKMYRKLEKNGELDYFGGGEYIRMKEHWIQHGCKRVTYPCKEVLVQEFEEWWLKAEPLLHWLGNKEYFFQRWEDKYNPYLF
jgi:hypothetical protein